MNAIDAMHVGEASGTHISRRRLCGRRDRRQRSRISPEVQPHISLNHFSRPREWGGYRPGFGYSATNCEEAMAATSRSAQDRRYAVPGVSALAGPGSRELMIPSNDNAKLSVNCANEAQYRGHASAERVGSLRTGTRHRQRIQFPRDPSQVARAEDKQEILSEHSAAWRPADDYVTHDDEADIRLRAIL